MKKVFLGLVLVAFGVAIGHFIKGPEVIASCDCVQEALNSGLNDCADWAKLQYEGEPNATDAEKAAAMFAEMVHADAPTTWTGPRICKETDDYGEPQDVFSLTAINHRVDGEEDRASELLPLGKVVVVRCIPADPRKIQGREIYGVDPERNKVVLKSHAG